MGTRQDLDRLPGFRNGGGTGQDREVLHRQGSYFCIATCQRERLRIGSRDDLDRSVETAMGLGIGGLARVHTRCAQRLSRVWSGGGDRGREDDGEDGQKSGLDRHRGSPCPTLVHKPGRGQESDSLTGARGIANASRPMNGAEFQTALRELLAKAGGMADNVSCLACEACESCRECTFCRSSKALTRCHYSVGSTDCTDCTYCVACSGCVGCHHSADSARPTPTPYPAPSAPRTRSTF